MVMSPCMASRATRDLKEALCSCAYPSFPPVASTPKQPNTTVRISGSTAWLFYPLGKAPEGAGTDGRTWRLKVGQEHLEPATAHAGRGRGGGKHSIRPARYRPASQTGQRLDPNQDPNQELIGQGLGNLAGAFSASYPVAGSFSRSALNLQAGAVSGMSALFTALAVLAVLLFFTPLLYHLPMPVLAAVIMMAVVGLSNLGGFLHAWRAQRYDGLISLITFAATLAFAPHLDRGIMIGAGLSLLVFLYKSMRPTVASLAVKEDGSFHDAEHFHLKQCRYVAMIRFDGPLFFANASFLEDQIRKKRLSMPELRHVIVVGEGISELDASGEEALSHIVGRLASAGIGISFAGLHWRVIDVLKRTHLYHKIGENNFYDESTVALQQVHAAAHRNSREIEACPLLQACKLN